MDKWDSIKKIREYDCPRCNKHHRIPYSKVSSFTCKCSANASSSIVLGQYIVKFINKSNKKVDRDCTLISWLEKDAKPLYDILATIEKTEKIFGKNIANNPIAYYYFRNNSVYAMISVEEVKSIIVPGFRYKITLQDIEKLMLLR
jgi:hypothetical protein